MSLVTASILAPSLAACAGSGTVEEYWAARFDHYRSLATSDFERGVLADNTITRAEYEEALQRYVDCMSEHGSTVATYEIYHSGVYAYQVTRSDEGATPQCARGTTEIIEQLYLEHLGDPQNRGTQVAVTDCLKRKGLLPADYDVADYGDDSADGFREYFDTSDRDVDEVYLTCLLNPAL